MNEKAPNSTSERWRAMSRVPTHPIAATTIRPANRTPVPDSSEVAAFGPSAGTCDSTSLMVDLRPAFRTPHCSVGHATG